MMLIDKIEILKKLSDSELDKILENGTLSITERDVKKEINRRDSDYAKYENKCFLLKTDKQIVVLKTSVFNEQIFEDGDIYQGLPLKRIDFEYNNVPPISGQCRLTATFSSDFITSHYNSFFKQFDVVTEDVWNKYLNKFNAIDADFKSFMNKL